MADALPDPDAAIHTNLERETKLSVPATFTLPSWISNATADDVFDPGAAKSKAAKQPGWPRTARYTGRRALRATYYDTADLRLARSGITLRHRTGEGKPVWTLKVPADSAIAGERVERSVVAAATAIPESLIELVTATTRTEPLAPVTRLTTRRDAWDLRDAHGTPVAELVDDVVSVIDGRKVVSRFREIEIERASITDEGLGSLAAQLIASGAVQATGGSKLARALGPRADAPPDVPEPIDVRKNDPAAALVVHAMRTSVRRLLAQDIGVRLGHEDAVHQMRVACRRLRSDLRTFDTLFRRGSTDVLRDELAWLADALGAARDLEVLRLDLAKLVRADPLSPLDEVAFGRLDDVLVAHENEALTAAAAALREPRYRALLDLAVDSSREPALSAAAKRPAREVLPALVARVVHDLDRKVAKLRPHAPDAHWHAARIRAKRARYAAEAAATAIGKPATRTASAMAEVQSVLGDHQDAAVAAETLLTIAAEHTDDAGLVLLCGQLAERERYAVRAARARFPEVWKAASATPVRAWLPTTGTNA